MSNHNHLTPVAIPHFNKYVEPTLELVLSLLAAAYEDEAYLDRVLYKMSEEVFAELKKEIEKLAKDGKIDLEQKINLSNNPAILAALKRIEQEQLRKFTDYIWMGSQVIGESMKRAYIDTLAATYQMFNYTKAIDPHNLTIGPKSLNAAIQVTDTYITEKVLNVPWCQDGKVYSQRLYGHVAQFQQKLAYVLEEGISKGKGMDWMMESWRKLTGSTAYDTARLLKTETMAMWSTATKSAYLEMGIEYVVMVGDAECGGICLDYVDGDPIPLAEAEIGDLLPPYHPNCACSFVAWEEAVPVELLDEEIY